MIGVGGISSKEDAAAKFKLGADLIQIYTSFIYQGPALVTELVAADRIRHTNT
jgi:dihydroorotate dehydrogenase